MKHKAFMVIMAALIIMSIVCCAGCVKKKDTDNTIAPTAAAANHVYIRYANVKPTADGDILPIGSYGPWLGIATVSDETAPTDYSKYNWAKIQGNDGANGKDGKDGLNGLNGNDGADGKSAYEIYLEYASGTVLTEEQWLESLKGKDGKDGKDGLNGLNGANGKDGNGTSVKITSIKNSLLSLKVNSDGSSIYLLKVYATVPTTDPTFPTIEYTGCSACGSVIPYITGNQATKYYIESGDYNVPGSQIIISIPVAPKLKNYFVNGDTFSINVKGVNVEFATVSEAAY